MPRSPNELASRTTDGLVIRTDAVRASWLMQGLPTGDDHLVHCRFSAAVRCVDSPADRKLFEEQFLSDERLQVTVSQIVEYLQAPLRKAAAAMALGLSAEQAISGKHDQAFIQTLVQAAQPLCFAAGIELVAPMQVHLESPSLQQQVLEKIARQRADQLSAEHVRELQRAAEVLRRFYELRQSLPDLSPGALLERISPSDRGQVFKALLLSGSDQEPHRTLFSVAGSCLIRVDPSTGRIDTTELPTLAGPFRSIQSMQAEGPARLLIGAQRGIVLLDPDNPAQAVAYLDPESTSSLGFNKVVYRTEDSTLWATHSEAGLVMWRWDEPNQPARVFRLPELRQSISISHETSSGPGHLTLLDSGRLVFSLGSNLVLVDEDRCKPLGTVGSNIVGLIRQSPSLVITRSGGLFRLDQASSQPWLWQQRPYSITAAATMPWMGRRRILLAGEHGPVDCLGEEDSLITQYVSVHRSLRGLTACQRFIAGLSADRQRVVIWDVHEGSRPRGEILVTPLVRHRLVDLASV